MEAKRVIFTAPSTVKLETFEISESVSDHEVLIETECTLISPGTERAFLLSLPNAKSNYPIYPGYSNIGRVRAIGGKVEDLKIGDRVATSRNHTSHFKTRSDRVIKIDNNAKSENLLFFNLTAIALQGIRKAKIELGETIVVLGQGLIGLIAIQLAKLSGGFPTIAIDLSENRLVLSKRIGADFAVQPQSENYDQQLDQATGFRGRNVVIEATGHPQAISDALKITDRFGRIILLGSTRGETDHVNFYRDVHKKGLTIIGAHNSTRPTRDSSANFWTSEDDQKLALQLIAEKRLNVSPLISHRRSVDEVIETYRSLANWSDDLLGVVIRWN